MMRRVAIVTNQSAPRFEIQRLCRDTGGNPADPDASYNAHKGQGMAQIVETLPEV